MLKECCPVVDLLIVSTAVELYVLPALVQFVPDERWFQVVDPSTHDC